MKILKINLLVILVCFWANADARKCYPVPRKPKTTTTAGPFTTPVPANPFWVAKGDVSPAMNDFLEKLKVQLSDPNWPTHNDYIFSPDFMWNSGVTYDEEGNEQQIPSACEGGPKGELPAFDFLVLGVGGGTLVAARLAKAFPTKTVLLVDAGPEAPINSIPPGMFIGSIEGTQGYKAKCADVGKAFNSGVKLSVWRALGGASNGNGMAFLCGTDSDYNALANRTGDPSWNYTNMLPHIKSVMNMQDKSLLTDPQCADYYGTSGELSLNSYAGDENSIIDLLKQAAQDDGIENVEDFNCGKYIGMMRPRGTVYNGETLSAAKAFLAPLKDQKNLMILRNTLVDKVLISDPDENGKVQVQGVRVVTKESQCPSFDLMAKNEVVLSAGAFNTPLILQRSGVGPKSVLEKFNVAPKLQLNVGGNYRNQFASLHFMSLPSPSMTEEERQAFIASEIERYLTTRQGQFASTSTLDTFINTDDPTSKYPNIQWHFMIFQRQQSEFRHTMETTFDIKPDFVDQLEAINNNSALIFIMNVLLKPKSSGTVALSSLNPKAAPNIDANHLSNQEDAKTMISGIRRLQQFAASSGMAGADGKFERVPIDECDQLEFDSDDYWKCYLSYFTQTFAALTNPSGTAKMGRDGDADAVVDNRLRVIGVQGKPGLRVADASPIPDEMSCNTQCGVYSLAAKAAAMIIEDNQ